MNVQTIEIGMLNTAESERALKNKQTIQHVSTGPSIPSSLANRSLWINKITPSMCGFQQYQKPFTTKKAGARATKLHLTTD